MAFYLPDELQDLYKETKSESYEWRRDYPEYERLADNGLLEDLDEDLPETNDGTLSASLFKLPKRVVGDLTGRFKALDADDAWITELANIYWENRIFPNANTDATPKRKQKDIVRKAAVYGSQPSIQLLVDDGNGGTKADFIVPYVQDVRLEPGKVSDQASDIIFWDVYYTRKQVESLIEQAKRETKENQDGYNKWNVKALEAIHEAGGGEEDRDSNEDHKGKESKSVTKGGIKFCIAFQRGVKAPFYMYHHKSDSVVREWENPDPTGDIPVKYLYCYQDFNNPYGIGIVKLAGGTQNVLDIMRMNDVLATQTGVRPPKMIMGNEDEVDFDSLVYATNADWITGNAKVELVNLANGVYDRLPQRIEMYQSSLNKMLPLGDTTVSATAGDPMQSKTPAGVKQAQAMLSIDDDDFKDNLHEWWESVAKQLVNLTFANMQGTDLLKLNDEERDILAKAGLKFPLDKFGEPTNELEIIWDEARATFDFELDAEDTKAKDEEKRLEGLIRVLELRTTDPMLDQKLMMSGKRFNDGELLTSIIQLTTDNKNILQDIDPEELEGMQSQMQAEQMMAQQPPVEQEAPQVTPEEAQANVEAVMAEYSVDQSTAAEMLMLEEEGTPPEQIQEALMMREGERNAVA
jgi:hypothetical protein